MLNLSFNDAFAQAATKQNLRARLRWAPPFFLATSLLIAGQTAAAEGAAPAATEKGVRGHRLIQTTCDAVGSETAAKGQFVCQYVCRDTDRTKLAMVYSNSGSGQCRSPISRQIKQTIKSP